MKTYTKIALILPLVFLLAGKSEGTSTPSSQDMPSLEQQLHVIKDVAASLVNGSNPMNTEMWHSDEMKSYSKNISTSQFPQLCEDTYKNTQNEDLKKAWFRAANKFSSCGGTCNNTVSKRRTIAKAILIALLAEGKLESGGSFTFNGKTTAHDAINKFNEYVQKKAVTPLGRILGGG